MPLQKEPHLGRCRRTLQQQRILDYLLQIEILHAFQGAPDLIPAASVVSAPGLGSGSFPERIDDGQSAIYDLLMLQVFGVQAFATGFQRRRDNQRVINGKSMPPGDIQPKFMCRDGHGSNGKNRANGG